MVKTQIMDPEPLLSHKVNLHEKMAFYQRGIYFPFYLTSRPPFEKGREILFGCQNCPRGFFWGCWGGVYLCLLCVGGGGNGIPPRDFAAILPSI